MVRNVVVPARSSVVNVVSRAARRNRRPTHDRSTDALRRPSLVVADAPACSPLLALGMMEPAMAARVGKVCGCVGVRVFGISLMRPGDVGPRHDRAESKAEVITNQKI